MSATRFFARLLACAAVALLVGGCAAPDPNCPPAGARLPSGALYGDWEARIGGDGAVPLRVTLQPHPEYAGVRGKVLRGGAGAATSAQSATTTPVTPSAQLAGDINDDGLLLLDESADGQRISAVWEGEIQARSCGRVFRGLWRRAGEDQGQPFVLTRLPSTP